jgi:hypothetical protein
MRTYSATFICPFAPSTPTIIYKPNNERENEEEKNNGVRINVDFIN